MSVEEITCLSEASFQGFWIIISQLTFTFDMMLATEGPGRQMAHGVLAACCLHRVQKLIGAGEWGGGWGELQVQR